LDGDKCIGHLQQIRQFDHPFIVVYSSSIPDDLKLKISNSGIDKVMQKTDSIPELAQQIQQVVSMR